MTKQDVRKIDENSIVQELTQRIEKNKKNLLLILDRWYYYNTILKAQIMFDYERHFGPIEIELRKRRREAKELERRMEILERKQKNGERINDFTLKIVDTIIKKEFNKFYTKPTQKKNYYTNFNFSFNNKSSNSYSNNRTYGFGNNQEANNNYVNDYHYNSENNSVHLTSYEEFQKDNEIPHLYRNIVKKIHPDIVGTSEEFTKYWYNVQDAYHSGDIKRLQLFNLTLGNDEPKNMTNLREQAIYLKKQLTALKTGIEIGKKKVEELRFEEPFIYIDKLKNKLWITKRKRALKEKLLQVNRTIDIKSSQLNRIISAVSYQENCFISNNHSSYS